MKMGEVFDRDVTRNIPPVVYFHEQTAAKLADEVSEYIVTGGYPEGDPRQRRVPQGIHEQYVRLLEAIARELNKSGGPELPASWISGFYGSGKSSFAKLLGLALNGNKLPDGRPLADALLGRDDSPRKKELYDAWSALQGKVKPIAVVFDIGGEAHDGEHIHSAVRRLIQRRLGYAKNPLVADAELRLEIDGQWEHFLEAAKHTLKGPWETFRQQERCDEHFSEVMAVMEPTKYRDSMSWLLSRAGTSFSEGLGVTETVRNIQSMLERHAPGATLFIVVDEVSQYVHQSDDRMLKLQSFVSELGQRLKGKAWLLATGQQQLEERGGSTTLGKLKDRFPPSLRVHLHTTNIRDVVHRRLLKKSPAKEEFLRKLFENHGSKLKLYGYKCDQLTEDEFLETYPLLPEHIDLLMQLTTSLRIRSSRSQGDDYAIRGLLQLLGELFREKKLANEPLGRLVTLDDIYDLQATAFDGEEQATMNRILASAEVAADAWAIKAVKAIKLLELNHEKEPVRDELIASCLYGHLGDENPLHALKPVLERLRNINVISFSEKEGYKIQSSAGQEWQRERDDFAVGIDERNRLIREKLADLMRDPERPKLNGRAFYWSALFSDGRAIVDERLLHSSDEACVTIDFRFPATKRDQTKADWAGLSADQQHTDRIVWVATEQDLDVIKELGKSRAMLAKYQQRSSSLAGEKKKLLLEEQDRRDHLEAKASKLVESMFVEGTLYFRGKPEAAREYGATFNAVMSTVGTARLPQLYPHHTDVAVTDTELQTLLLPVLAGVSAKFLDGKLGLLSQDGARFLPTCNGPVPKLVYAYIEKNEGTAGNVLLQDFARPPYGFPSDVVRACVVALLRDHRVKLKLEDGSTLTSVGDANTRETFLGVTKFKRTEIFPNKDETITQRDLVAMRRFFEKLGQDLEPSQEVIADAVFKHFVPLRERLRTLEARFNQLPGRPEIEDTLKKLARALEHCRSERDVAPTIKALKAELPVLTEGVQVLQRLHTDFSEEALEAVRQAAEVRDFQVAQLQRDMATGPVEEDITSLVTQLKHRRPWQDIGALKPALERIIAHYQERRLRLLQAQETSAEAARNRLRARPGFVKLTDDETHRVFRPIALALTQTTAAAVAPPLHELQLEFEDKLRRGAEEATALFDDLLSAKDQRPVTRIDTNLHGRELTTRAELTSVLKELEERVGEQLDLGRKVRLS